jgi:hypothetical protein
MTDFTAGVEAMRAALVEYFRVWPRDDMTADLISKFDVPSHFLRPTAAPAESARCSECGMPSPWHESKCSHAPSAGIRTPTETPPLSSSEPAGAPQKAQLLPLPDRLRDLSAKHAAKDWPELQSALREAADALEPAGAPSDDEGRGK